MKKLHDLIHSLSQAEKRHVTLRLTNTKDSSLLSEYYDILCKQKIYSFEELLNSAGKPMKLTQSNVSLLYEIILEDLRYIVEEQNIDVKLRNNLADVKMLVYKGFLDEAESRCLKLILKAKKNEEFALEQEGYKELWNLNLKRGTIKLNEISKIQDSIDEITSKLQTLEKIQSLYRKLTAHYYNYFFFNATDRMPDSVKAIFSEVDQIQINSNKSKYAYFELKAMECILKADFIQHHNIRKEQLILCLTMKISDPISALMILSNIFTKLKIESNINELEAYMELLESDFFDFSGKQKNYILLEKYYDIYFTNHSFIKIFQPNRSKTEILFKLFDFVTRHKYVTNEIILSRIQLALIELRLIEEDHIEVINQIENYLTRFKKNKKTIQYVEAQILEAIAIYFLKNFDAFINKLEQINRQVKVQKIILSNDLQVIVNFLDCIANSHPFDKKDFLDQIKHRQTFKLYIFSIADKIPFSEVRKKYFFKNDSGYQKDQDTYLQNIKKLMRKKP